MSRAARKVRMQPSAGAPDPGAGLTLSEAEIRHITGLVQPAAQERFLREEKGIPAYRNRANEVVVFRADVAGQPAPARRRRGPDLDWLDRTG